MEAGRRELRQCVGLASAEIDSTRYVAVFPSRERREKRVKRCERIVNQSTIPSKAFNPFIHSIHITFFFSLKPRSISPKTRSISPKTRFFSLKPRSIFLFLSRRAYCRCVLSFHSLGVLGGISLPGASLRSHTPLLRGLRALGDADSLRPLPSLLLPLLQLHVPLHTLRPGPLRIRVSPRKPAQRHQMPRPILLRGRSHRLLALRRRDPREPRAREHRVPPLRERRGGGHGVRQCVLVRRRRAARPRGIPRETPVRSAASRRGDPNVSI